MLPRLRPDQAQIGIRAGSCLANLAVGSIHAPGWDVLVHVMLTQHRVYLRKQSRAVATSLTQLTGEFVSVLGLVVWTDQGSLHTVAPHTSVARVSWEECNKTEVNYMGVPATPPFQPSLYSPPRRHILPGASWTRSQMEADRPGHPRPAVPQPGKSSNHL